LEIYFSFSIRLHGAVRDHFTASQRDIKMKYSFIGVDGRIILRWIFRNWDVRSWTGSSWLRIGTGGGHL